MEETKAAMQKALSINIAEYLEDHINDKSDIRIVLQFIANNPEHVEKVIKKHLQLDVIDMGKIVKAIGPDIAKDMIDGYNIALLELEQKKIPFIIVKILMVQI